MDFHENSPVERLMKNAFGTVFSSRAADMVLGSPIKIDGKSTLVPISKVSFGLIAGGGEYGEKNDVGAYPFGGASGSGMNVTPIAFLVCDGEKVKVVNIDEKSPFTLLTEMLPEIVKNVIAKDEKKD
jgi:sporulation protein YtfJ